MIGWILGHLILVIPAVGIVMLIKRLRKAKTQNKELNK
jgi:hypothetical protein